MGALCYPESNTRRNIIISASVQFNTYRGESPSTSSEPASAYWNIYGKKFVSRGPCCLPFVGLPNVLQIYGGGTLRKGNTVLLMSQDRKFRSLVQKSSTVAGLWLVSANHDVPGGELLSRYEHSTMKFGAYPDCVSLGQLMTIKVVSESSFPETLAFLVEPEATILCHPSE